MLPASGRRACGGREEPLPERVSTVGVVAQYFVNQPPDLFEGEEGCVEGLVVCGETALEQLEDESLAEGRDLFGQAVVSDVLERVADDIARVSGDYALPTRTPSTISPWYSSNCAADETVPWKYSSNSIYILSSAAAISGRTQPCEPGRLGGLSVDG